MYYDSGNEPVEALGRFARRVGSGGALYIGGGVGVEKVNTSKGDRYALTRADAKQGEQFAGPLSAVMRAFSTAGQATSADSPGGAAKISDPAAAARLHELRDMERQTRKEIDRVQARIAAKQPKVSITGLPTPNAIDEASYDVRRLAELKRDLSQIQSERTSLIETGKVEEAEVGKPGTNWTQVTPEHRKRVNSLVEYYRKKPHPFTACVRDNRKRFGPNAEKVCAVVKDMGERTTKWRKGGGHKLNEDIVIEAALDRILSIDATLGAGAAIELAEGEATGSNLLTAIGEGAYDDLVVLALAGHPLGRVWEAVAGGAAIPDPLGESFNEKLHPRSHQGPHGGEFVKKLFGAGDTLGAIKPRHKDRIPEGSGPKRPSAEVTTRHVPRAPGTGAEAQLARETKGVNQRKLTDKELPNAVGHGPWDAAVEQTVKTLRSDPSSETDKLYRDASGHYTPERIELHARIIRALLQGAGAHPEDKQAIFLAGGPASGKSTLLKSGHVKPPSDAVEVNPDVIKLMLPEYKALVAAGDPRAAAAVHEESSHIAKWLTNLAMAREHHVVIDGVGNSGPGTFGLKIQKAVDHGYNTGVHYATVDTEEAVKRAEARAKNPKSDSYGRVVNQGYLRSAHAHVTDRFNENVRHMKGVTVRVIDTQGRKPKVIYERFPGQAEKIRDKKGFDRFQAKGTNGNAAA